MTRAVVLFSGGLDSTTLLHLAASRSQEVVALGVKYGQRHVKELGFARSTAASLGIKFLEMTVPIGFGASTLLEKSEERPPEGHYAEESMKKTVVPNRNMVMISLAASLAEARGFDQVWTAVHAGDHFIYPDCRPAFIEPMGSAIRVATEGRVDLVTPFLYRTKAQIVQLGMGLGVDYGMTWSCYQGGDLHCGVCGTCVERIEAFRLAQANDPTEYENLAGGLRILVERERVLTERKGT